jgi:drug/metabolite transporter (DMT)-like permease
LFGASTPFAKVLVGDMAPLMLAGLLYLGSGVGLTVVLSLRGGRIRPSLQRGDWRWLVAAIFFGGVAGPALLLYGLVLVDGAAASLLLNLESVFTAVLAWTLFRENVDRRILLGMLAIVAGGVVLSWHGTPGAGGATGAVLIAGACLCWALDNNLTRRVSGGDATLIAALKGLAAGAVNFVLALVQGASLPSPLLAASASVLGLLGYGVSLVLFIRALRDLGAARTGAYFSVAPFFGAALALVLLHESAGPAFWLAAGLMALGVWLHITEHHEHEHVHEPREHAHEHSHDEHHQHQHDPAWDGRAPHSHMHRHSALRHRHPHYPDLHHRHTH